MPFEVCPQFSENSALSAAPKSGRSGNDTTGKFEFDSRAQNAIRDADVDPRVHSAGVNDYSPAKNHRGKDLDGSRRHLSWARYLSKMQHM